MKRSIGFRVVVCALAVSACAERQSPVEPFTVPSPRLLITPPAPINDQNLPVDEMNPAYTFTLPTYTEAVIAEFRVSGTIFAAAQPLSSKPNHVIDAAGFYSDSFTACYVNIRFSFTQGFWGPAPCSRSPVQETTIDTALVQGQGTVKRGAGIPKWDYECNYGICWKYSGTQSFSLTPLSAAITLLTPGTTQSPTGVIALPPPGTSTTLQVSSLPATLKGIQVPIRVISWNWLRRPGGDGATTDNCTGRTTVLCNMTFTETGSVIVTAVINGLEQVDTLIVRAPEVQITVQRDTMLPSVRYIKKNGISVNILSKQIVTVTVTNDAGPIRYQTVSLLSTATDGTAGHINHPANSKPRGGFRTGSFTMQFNTGVSGTDTVTFVAPDPSGPVTITGALSGARKGFARVHVGVKGLVRLPLNDPAYDTTGGTQYHTDNHNVTQNHLGYLVALASVFGARNPNKRLTYNDSSLPSGGLFDNAGSWTYPHRTHRFGRETDIRIIDLTDYELDDVRDIWVHDFRADVGPEGDPPHWHLTTPIPQ